MGLHIGKKIKDTCKHAKNFAKHPGRTTKKCVSKACNKLGRIGMCASEIAFTPALLLSSALNRNALFNMNNIGLNHAYPQFLPNQSFMPNFRYSQVNIPNIFTAQPGYLRNIQLNSLNEFI